MTTNRFYTNKMYRNANTKSVVTVSYDYGTGYLEANTLKGEAVTPEDMLTVLEMALGSDEIARNPLTCEWRIYTHYGMSGCADMSLLVRDYKMEEFVGYPTDGKQIGKIHVSCYGKLNHGVAGRSDVLMRLLTEAIGEGYEPVKGWYLYTPAEYTGEWRCGEEPHVATRLEVTPEGGPDGLPAMEDEDN